jgi:hypothetical protein
VNHDEDEEMWEVDELLSRLLSISYSEARVKGILRTMPILLWLHAK